MTYNEKIKALTVEENFLAAAQLYVELLQELADDYENHDIEDRDTVTKAWILSRYYKAVTTDERYAELNAALINLNNVVTNLLLAVCGDDGTDAKVEAAQEEVILSYNAVQAALEGLDSETTTDGTAASRACFFAWLEGLDLLDNIKLINNRVKNANLKRETNDLIEKAFDTITRLRRELVNVQAAIGNK